MFPYLLYLGIIDFQATRLLLTLFSALICLLATHSTHSAAHSATNLPAVVDSHTETLNIEGSLSENEISLRSTQTKCFFSSSVSVRKIWAKCLLMMFAKDFSDPVSAMLMTAFTFLNHAMSLTFLCQHLGFMSLICR